MEIKSGEMFVKEIQGRTVTGIASVFGNVDHGGDRVIKGAFKKTLQDNADHIRFLWQHDFSKPPVAAIKDIAEVSRSQLPGKVRDKYPEATGGLQVTREYLDTPAGSEVLAGIKAGAIKEMSFGFDAIKFDLEELDGKSGDGPVLVRNLRQLQLYDVSDVNWGMNPATAADGAKWLFSDLLGSEPSDGMYDDQLAVIKKSEVARTLMSLRSDTQKLWKLKQLAGDPVAFDSFVSGLERLRDDLMQTLTPAQKSRLKRSKPLSIAERISMAERWMEESGVNAMLAEQELEEWDEEHQKYLERKAARQLFGRY